MKFSSKRLQVDKANLYIVIITSVATFVTIFSLVGSWTLLGQRSYQAKVVSQKEKAKKQLETNIQSVNSLKTSYQTFVAKQPNVIGGDKSGTGDRDGDNAKIVLDALPSKYDFPALATSLEKIITSKDARILSINGTDDELSQSDTSGAQAGMVEMPFSLSVATTYGPAKDIFALFENSVRPFKISSIDIATSDNSELTVNVTAKTYYQPATSLKVKSEVVK